MKRAILLFSLAASTAYGSPALLSRPEKRGVWPPTYCKPLESILERARNDPRVPEFCSELLSVEPYTSTYYETTTETDTETPYGYVPTTTVYTTSTSYAATTTVTETPTTTLEAANTCLPDNYGARLLKRYDDYCSTNGLEAIKALPYYSQRIACACLKLEPPSATITETATSTTTTTATQETITLADATVTSTPTETFTAPAATATPISQFYIFFKTGGSYYPKYDGTYWNPFTGYDTRVSTAAIFIIDAQGRLVTLSTDPEAETPQPNGAIAFTRNLADDPRYADGIVFFALPTGAYRAQDALTCCINRGVEDPTENSDVTGTGDTTTINTLTCWAHQDPAQNAFDICPDPATPGSATDYVFLTENQQCSATGEGPVVQVIEVPGAQQVLSVGDNSANSNAGAQGAQSVPDAPGAQSFPDAQGAQSVPDDSSATANSTLDGDAEGQALADSSSTTPLSAPLSTPLLGADAAASGGSQ